MRFARGLVLAMMTMFGVQGAMAAVTVTKADFGKLPDGRAVDSYTLKNADLEVRITTYGARIVSLKTKDRDGKMGDVVLGYNSVEGYVAEATAGKKTYFGAIVGRYGNRIRGGKFSIDGTQYRFRRTIMATRCTAAHTDSTTNYGRARRFPDGVEMSLVSKDGDMGFPGTLTVHVRYTLVGAAAAHQLLGDDRQTDGDEHYQPRVLQPLRRRLGHHPGRSAGDQCGRLHAGGRGADSGGRREAGRRNAVRLPQADARSGRGSMMTTSS